MNTLNVNLSGLSSCHSWISLRIKGGGSVSVDEDACIKVMCVGLGFDPTACSATPAGRFDWAGVLLKMLCKSW